MSNKLMNMIRLQASITNNARTMTDLGVVTGYDPQNYLVTVEIYPADPASNTPSLQTGWIPLFTPWAGNGWGLFLPPNIGDIIEVHYQAGSLQNAYAALRSFNFNALPLAVQSGEAWLVHQSGSFIKLTNDGKVAISSTVEIDVTAPVVNVDSAQVNIGELASVLALLNANAYAVYNAHTHASPSAPPVPQMTSLDLTTNTFAS